MNLDPCSQTLDIPVIYKGENKTLTIVLTDIHNQPIDITGVTEIEALFLKDDNTVLHKKLSLSEVVLISAPGGKFSILLLPADTSLLKVDATDTYSDIELRYTIAGSITYVQLTNSIQVKNSLFPV